MMVTTELVEASSIDGLYFEYKLWRTQLDFFREEIKIYIHRLEELLTKKNQKEMLSQAEHFQNQFIRQNEVIDELYHDAKAHENNIQKLTNNGNIDPDFIFDEHESLEEQMQIFEKIYMDLKMEFNHFVARWR